MAIEKSVNVVIAAQDKFSGPMTSLGGAWGTIAKGALAAEAAILAASIAAAKFSYDIAKNVIQSAVDFGDAIYDISAVAASFGTTTEDISNILDDLVNRFPVTGAEAGAALETIAQKGFGAKEQLAALGDTALNLSIATGRDLDTAVALLTNTMNVFGLEVEDTDRLMNLFSATQFSSAASVDGLVEAMKYGGIAMAQNNQTVETAAAAFGLLANKGLEASQMGTVLRMGLANLYKETEKGTEVLKKYGLTYDDVNPSTQDFADIIEKLGDKNGPVFTAKDAVDLFGVRQQALGFLITEGADAFREYRDSITGTSAGVDALDEKLKKFNVVVNNLGGSMDIFKKTIGADLANAMAELIGYDERSGIRGVITFLYEMEKAQGGIGGEMLETFNNLKEIFGTAFNEAFPDMESFYNWLVQITAAAGTNIEIVGSFVAMVLKGFVQMTESTSTMVTALGLVQAAFTLLALPVAIFHDMVVTGLTIASEIGQTVYESIRWVYEKLLGLSLTVQTALSKLPFSEITDQELEDLRAKLEEVKKSNEGAFDIELPKLWTAEVVKGGVAGVKSIIDFANTAADEHKKVDDAIHSNLGEWKDLAARVEEGGEAVEAYGHKNIDAMKSLWTEMDKVEQQAKDIPAELQEWAQKLRDAGLEVEKVGKNFITVKGSTDDVAYSVGEIKAKAEEAQISSKKVGDTWVLVGGETDKAAGYVEKTVNGVTLLTNETGKAAQSFVTVKDGVVDVSSSIEEANAKGGLDLKTEDAKTKLDIFKAEISAFSDIIQTKIEWEAKIEIAQLEEDTKRAVASAETIRDSFVAAAEATSAAFGGLAEVGGAHFYEYLALVERQLSIQESLAAAQIAFMAEQTEYFKLRNDALRRGEAASQVNVAVEGDMEGWLAGLMESLFKDIFIKASAEGFNVLAEG